VGFQTLGLQPAVLKGILTCGFKVPTPIQRRSMPVVLAGKDVVAMARTGSGKTAAFVVPMLNRLQEHMPGLGCRGVILSPTRELTIQTMTFVRKIAKYTGLKVACLVGGDSMDQQFQALANFPDIIVATPGRLMHHLKEVPTFNLKNCEMVVFDEADRLFEMGFSEQLHEILSGVPETRQTLLFSATLPQMIVQFARAGLNDPELIRLDVEHALSKDLRMAFLSVRSEEKLAIFLYLFRVVIPRDDQSIVFAATRHHVDLLEKMLVRVYMYIYIYIYIHIYIHVYIYTCAHIYICVFVCEYKCIYENLFVRLAHSRSHALRHTAQLSRPAVVCFCPF
jgi:ATP-dependent RNA helicase DDX54/DBP10